jgi:uncharacterized protein with HEPN domain
MKKDDSIYVGHMLDASRSIVSKVTGVKREAFDRDENLRLAIAHLIQTIGEAATRVSTDYRSAHPEVPWRAIIGMRQKIVHDYMHIDYDIVWGVGTKELERLIPLLEPLASGSELRDT